MELEDIQSTTETDYGAKCVIVGQKNRIDT